MVGSNSQRPAYSAALRASSPGRHGAVTLALAALMASITAGCAPLDNPYAPYPEPDYETFVLDVQPMIADGCASSGCHGVHARTLTLYAVDHLRAEPLQVGAPIEVDILSEGELAWNYDALRVRTLGERKADNAMLLLKCLDPKKGGLVHADGFVVFEDRDDPDLVLLRDWIESGL